MSSMEALLQLCAVLAASKEGLQLLQGQGLLEALVPLTRALLHQGLAGLPPLLRTQVVDYFDFGLHQL